MQAGSPDSPVQRGPNVSRGELEKLVARFRDAHYFGLERAYKVNAFDLPTHITSISIKGESMSVIDYGGQEVGMPTSVRDLEKAIDDVAHTKDLLPIRPR